MMKKTKIIRGGIMALFVLAALLLVYLVVPAMIVNSYRMEFSMEILHNLLASFGMSLLALLMLGLVYKKLVKMLDV